MYWVLEWSYTHTWAYTVHAHTHLKHLDRLQKVPPSVTLVFLKRGLKYFLCPLCAFTYLSTPFDLLTVSVPRTELFTSYTIWTTLSLSGLLSAIFLELQPKTVEWTQTYKSLLRHLKNRSKNLLKLFFWLLHITSTLKTPFFLENDQGLHTKILFHKVFHWLRFHKLWCSASRRTPHRPIHEGFL